MNESYSGSEAGGGGHDRRKINRIELLAWGSEGDVRPFMALGGALRRAGFDVGISSYRHFQPLADHEGLRLTPISGDITELLQSEDAQKMLEDGNNPLKIAVFMAKNADLVGRRIIQDLLRSCSNADLLVLCGPAFFPGTTVAEVLHVPYIQAYVQPMYPTSAYPSALLPFHQVDLPGPLNMASGLILRQLFWQILSGPIIKVREQMFNLPRFPLTGPFHEQAKTRWPILMGFSEHVVPRASDWPEFIHQVGYWFVSQADTFQPDAELAQFLESGAPPVYIGFGSMSNRNPEQTAELALKALDLTGHRGLLASGWGGLKAKQLPSNAHVIERAPHDWLFPRMQAIVHHSGAGTTAASLRAGVPSVPVPFFGDQPFWAERLKRSGVAPTVIYRSKLDADRLARAIDKATNDSTIRERAAEMGERIRSENGLGRAVSVIEQFAASSSPLIKTAK